MLFTELAQFKEATEGLGRVVRLQGALWKDEKYEALSRDVAMIGKQATQVIAAGNAARATAREFDRIWSSVK